jgi:hypothetical protein
MKSDPSGLCTTPDTTDEVKPLEQNSNSPEKRDSQVLYSDEYSDVYLDI